MADAFDGLPWAYRPRKYDDWGCIKNADGDIVLNIRPPADADLDAHRAAKTDPCEALGRSIVALANAATPAPSGRDPATIEACAKVADKMDHDLITRGKRSAARSIAAEIRALAAPAAQLTEER